MNLKTSDSINKAIELYIGSLEKKKQEHTQNNLRTTLNKTVFLKFDFGKKPLKGFGQYSEHITIAEFLQQAQAHFDACKEEIPENERKKPKFRNYESHFNRFISWLSLQKLELNIEQKSAKDIFKRNDISERAPRRNSGVHLQSKHKGRRQFSATVYCLTKKQIAQLERLNQQFKELENYLRADYKSTRDRDEPIRKITWKKYESECRGFLGWQKNIEKKCDGELSLILMSDLKTLNSYLEWHSLRGNSIRRSIDICSTALNVARCFQGIKSEAAQDIRYLKKKFSQNLRKDSHRRTSSKQALAEKLLPFNQCVEVVQYLRNCCAPKSFWGIKRSTSSIINSWQDYLIIAILTFTPVRQREIRELQIGKNLVRGPDGWWVTLNADEHKTGSKTGKGREYPLFCGPMKELLTADLDEYINKWRKLEGLDHNYLFFLRGKAAHSKSRGKPIPDTSHLSSLVPRLMFKTTAILFGKENAKNPSPHDFRRIFVTWFYQIATLAEQQVYAEILGHSPEEAQKTYLQLSSRDKTSKADQAITDVFIRSQQQATSDGKIFLSAHVEPTVLDSLTPQEKNLLVRLGFMS